LGTNVVDVDFEDTVVKVDFKGMSALENNTVDFDFEELSAFAVSFCFLA
jgi:hypothetical protein